MQPFRCHPIYKEKVWGGQWLAEHFQRKLPPERKIGESWELSCRLKEMSRVVGGEFSGQILGHLVKEYPEEMLGPRLSSMADPYFPLLLKFLDVSGRLSIQVHPDDSHDLYHSSGEPGKSEIWYVLATRPNAQLMIGLKPGVSPGQLKEAIVRRNLDSCLVQIPTKPGDCFYIPPGTVHAILPGVFLAEIQQNSDITYRLYDWERVGLDGKPRALHIQEALEVIDYRTDPARHAFPGLVLKEEEWQCRILVACSQFAVEELLVKNLRNQVNPERFEVWMVIAGRGYLKCAGDDYSLLPGQTWMLPASLGNYELIGPVKLLKTYVPDLESEIIHPLLNRGYSDADLQQIGGLSI